MMPPKPSQTKKTTLRDSNTQDPIDPVNEPQVEVGDQPDAEDPQDAHQEEMAQLLARQEAFAACLAVITLLMHAFYENK